jgi:hypothetical protein
MSYAGVARRGWRRGYQGVLNENQLDKNIGPAFYERPNPKAA